MWFDVKFWFFFWIRFYLVEATGIYSATKKVSNYQTDVKLSSKYRAADCNLTWKMLAIPYSQFETDITFLITQINWRKTRQMTWKKFLNVKLRIPTYVFNFKLVEAEETDSATQITVLTVKLLNEFKLVLDTYFLTLFTVKIVAMWN